MEHVTPTKNLISELKAILYDFLRRKARISRRLAFEVLQRGVKKERSSIEVLDELSTLRFLANGENVLFLGPCGVGKTRLAIGLAVRALEVLAA